MFILIVGKLITNLVTVVAGLDTKTSELDKAQMALQVELAKRAPDDSVIAEIRKSIGKLTAIVNALKIYKEFLEKAIKDFFESLKGLFDIAFGR